jgi:trans-aconitate methyltransferase
MPSKEEYTKLISKSGFREISIELENADRFFSDCNEMIKWIDQPSIVPFMEYLPDEKKDSFRNAVADIMIDKTKQSDGTCFETFRRIALQAVK